MGLALQTGILATLKTTDAVLFQKYQDELQATVAHLDKNKVQHQFSEPLGLPTDRCWSTDMYGYSGLHYLRRLAAWIYFEKQLPEPGTWNAVNDPVLIRYFEQYLNGDNSTLLKQAFSTAKIFPFEHLIIHSDQDGFYLPVNFQRVITTEDNEISGGFIGSSYRLLEELIELADWLELDLDRNINDIDLYDAADTQGKGNEKWERYGVESFTCLKLYRGCLESVENRCALIFC